MKVKYLNFKVMVLVDIFNVLIVIYVIEYNEYEYEIMLL